MKRRLDKLMVQKGLVTTRSQAENYIKLGFVSVDSQTIDKSGQLVDVASRITLSLKQQYVSRAGLKLAGAAKKFKLDFKGKLVLDAGSSTGGFTDYALRHGAKKVIAVDVGSEQMDKKLRANPRVELHEKTDIRNLRLRTWQSSTVSKENIPNSQFIILDSPPDIVLVDVSFISLRAVLPRVARLANQKTQIIILLKPQFETSKDLLNKGVVKNDRQRRQIIKDFELWSQKLAVIRDKADSPVAGAHGNLERFYLLQKRH